MSDEVKPKDQLRECPFCHNMTELVPLKQNLYEGAIVCLRCGSKGPPVRLDHDDWQHYSMLSWNFRGYDK